MSLTIQEELISRFANTLYHRDPPLAEFFSNSPTFYLRTVRIVFIVIQRDSIVRKWRENNFLPWSQETRSNVL